MESAKKRWAFRVVVFLLLLILFPVVAANVTLIFGPLKGNEFAGRLLLALIENSDGPTPILQGIVTVILGVIGIATLWHEDGKYAVILIVLCAGGIALTWIIWAHLSSPGGAADLWQETAGPLNGTTFPPAMHAYMTSLMIALGVVLLGTFGAKAPEWLRGISR